MNYILILSIIISIIVILLLCYKKPVEQLTNKVEVKPIIHQNKLLFKLGDTMKWSSKPIKENKSLLINKQVGTIKLQQRIDDDFTIIMKLKTLGKDETKLNEVLSSTGNQSTALDIKIPSHYGSVNLKIGETRYVSKSSRTNHFNTYVITHKDGETDFYVNGNKENIKIHPEDEKTKVYFNTNELIINKDKEGNFVLNDLRVYDNFMTQSQLHKEMKKINTEKSKPKTKDKKSKDGMNNEIISYMKNGNYYIYIHKNSKWYNKFHKYGSIFYGNDREKAEKLFKQNFPGVKPPKHLDKDAPNPSANNCMFIGSKHNPCTSGYCRDVEWSNNPLEIKNLTDKCKTNVTSYCKQYSNDDPFCVCWSEESELYNTRHCKNIRRNFGEPQIASEVDMSKYIRKDQIPCWGCNL